MHSILNDVNLGERVEVYNFVNAYGCEVGDDSKIGSFVEIQRGAKIGKKCKISSHSFICEGVEIEDEVFIGHGVMFINDKFPKACSSDGELLKNGEWKMQKTLIRKGASIGSNSTILGGVEVGENAVIGAGSVVTKNVIANSIVKGNPAK